MKILILTQKVDRTDPILGFFHRWLEEFSKQYEKVTVICLEKGEFTLPLNVEVLSLGKEKKRSRIQYVLRLFNFAFRERNNYDVVFIHMNEEYVLLCGLMWKLFSKKIALWRNHKSGSILTTLSVWLSDIVFYTSPSSYTARFPKAKKMPVGIDVSLFSSNSETKPVPHSILMLGRISPVKKVHYFTKILTILSSRDLHFSASIVGSPITKEDYIYLDTIKIDTDFLIKKKILSFSSAVSHENVPTLYRNHEIYVNFTSAGSFDKTIFEAMCSGNLVLVSNQSLVGVLPKECITKEGNIEDGVAKIENLLSMPDEEKIILSKLLQKKAQEHDLVSTVKEIALVTKEL